MFNFFPFFRSQSYIIDPDFLMNYDIPDKKKPRKDLDDEDQRKCYPKRGTNIMPYQKIEFELRKDAHVWPPITKPHVDANNMPTSMSAARLTDMVVRANNENEMSRSTPSLKQNGGGGGGSFKKQLSSTSTANHHHHQQQPAPIKTMTGSSAATATTTAAKQQLLNSNSIELDDFYITKI